MSTRSHLELEWLQIPCLFGVVEKSSRWRMFATISGLFLASIRWDWCLCYFLHGFSESARGNKSDIGIHIQFGVFGICDGHGGVGAAKSASKLVLFSISLHHDLSCTPFFSIGFILQSLFVDSTPFCWFSMSWSTDFLKAFFSFFKGYGILSFSTTTDQLVATCVMVWL